MMCIDNKRREYNVATLAIAFVPFNAAVTPDLTIIARLGMLQ